MTVTVSPSGVVSGLLPSTIQRWGWSRYAVKASKGGRGSKQLRTATHTLRRACWSVPVTGAGVGVGVGVEVGLGVGIRVDVGVGVGSGAGVGVKVATIGLASSFLDGAAACVQVQDIDASILANGCGAAAAGTATVMFDVGTASAAAVTKVDATTRRRARQPCGNGLA